MILILICAGHLHLWIQVWLRLTYTGDTKEHIDNVAYLIFESQMID